MVILTPELGFVQKIEGKALGYDVQSALCVTSSEDCGRVGFLNVLLDFRI